jgi:outer membrane biosynthesis protein TonB
MVSRGPLRRAILVSAAALVALAGALLVIGCKRTAGTGGAPPAQPTAAEPFQRRAGLWCEVEPLPAPAGPPPGATPPEPGPEPAPAPAPGPAPAPAPEPAPAPAPEPTPEPAAEPAPEPAAEPAPGPAPEPAAATEEM